MTIEEAKDQVAKKLGYKSWYSMEYYSVGILDEAIRIYGEAQAKEAFEAARKFDFEAGKNYVFADYEDYKNSQS